MLSARIEAAILRYKDLFIMKQLSISYIIPAYNEELFLPHVLKNIDKYTPDILSYEVIVADNGSEDKTVQLARQAGARVIINKEATIGELRNLAVNESIGEILVFLDADILLTKKWADNIVDVHKSLLQNAYQVTGSRYGVPTPASWIEQAWFKPLVDRPSKYINSGHMIVSRTLFDRIGGFDKALETGEDFAFGQAALKVNAVIRNNSSLAVIHKGYPKTVYQFMRREMWHGRGDCVSLRSLISSKVSMAAILFVFLHVLLVFSLIGSSFFFSGVLISLILLMCMSASVFKHGARTLKSLVMQSYLYYLYFVSRFLSCVSFLSLRSVKRVDDS